MSSHSAVLKIFFTIIGIKLNDTRWKGRLGAFGNFNKVHHPLNAFVPLDPGVPIRGQILISKSNELGEGNVLIHLININKVDEKFIIKSNL